MSHLKIKPECIIEEFFKSIQKYVNEAIIERINLMDSLYDFSMKSWEIPKKYKGSSSQMGFIAEYLVFEAVKQYIAEENKISFFPVVPQKKMWKLTILSMTGIIPDIYCVTDSKFMIP